MPKGIKKSGKVKNGKKPERDSSQASPVSGAGSLPPSPITPPSTPTVNQNTSTSTSPSVSPSAGGAISLSIKEITSAPRAEPITLGTKYVGDVSPINLSGQSTKSGRSGKKSGERETGHTAHRCGRCRGKGKVKEGWVECPTCKGKGEITYADS